MAVSSALVAAFQRLGAEFHDDEAAWEVRYESPPGAYLHVSKPLWGDERMDGVHLEAYVTGNNDQMSQTDNLLSAVVALHCERGSPVSSREALMATLAKRVAPELELSFGPDNSKWVLLPKGLGGCSVCETQFALPSCSQASTGRGGRNPVDAVVHVDEIASQLRKLQTLAPLIDAAILELQLAEKG